MSEKRWVRRFWVYRLARQVVRMRGWTRTMEQAKLSLLKRREESLRLYYLRLMKLHFITSLTYLTGAGANGVLLDARTTHRT